MGGNASAAANAARSHCSQASGEAAESRQGGLAGRRLSDVSAGSRTLAVRETLETEAKARPGRMEKGLRSRQVKVAEATSREPETHAPSDPQGRDREPAGRPARGGRSPGPLVAGSSDGVAGSARPEPEPDSLRYRVPWLTDVQHAAREARDRELKAFAARHPDPKVQADLAAAIDLVQRVEKDISRADRLLVKSGRKTLSDAEWRKMYALFRRNQTRTLSQRSEICQQFERLAATGVFQSPQGGSVDELKFRLSNGHDYLQDAGRKWLGPGRLIKTPVPTGEGERLRVHGYVVPRRVFRAHLAQGCPSHETSKEDPVTHYTQVPDLAMTALTNTSGNDLFVGLHHGIVHANDLNRQFLAKRSDEEVKALLGALTVAPGHAETGEGSRGRRIEHECKAIRESRRVAAAVTKRMRGAACERMLKELVAAAVVSDPERLTEALNGKEVAVDCFSIALLAPGDVDAWSSQYDRLLDAEGRAKPLEIELLDAHGKPRRATVDVRFRQFVLPAADERLDLGDRAGVTRKATEWLLGSEPPGKLGGAVKAGLETLQRNTQKRSELMLAYESHHTCLAETIGEVQPQTLSLATHLLRLRRENEHVENQAFALEEAARRLKALWAQDGDWPTGVDEHRKVAALLALTGYLCGYIPLLSCMSGRDLTARLDADVKFLAAVVDNEVGSLPPHDLDTPEWRAARSAFTPDRAAA